jgi:hypothetical protein
MAVDRLSVTVPSELGSELRALAKARGGNVSSVVTDAIAREVRLAALDRALGAADERFGPLDDELVARAELDLAKAFKQAKRAHRRKPR